MGRSDWQRAVDRALVDVCRGEGVELPDAPGAAHDFVAGARYHRIAPLAHIAVRERHPDIADELKEDRAAALMNHLRTSALLARIGQILDGVDWLAFKGPILAEFAHPVPGLRFYKDLDLLVAPGEFRGACHRLLDEGWHVLLSEESLRSEEFPGEIALVDRHGVVMDLHWAMVVMKSVRARFDVTAEELLRRKVPVTIGPARLHAMSPADAIVHVCQHAGLVGATKLGHLLDADQLARQVVDWDEVVERAAQWGAGVQVAVVLGRARRLLGTPVPDGLAGQLGVGPTMRAALGRVDRHWQVARLRQDASWVRLVTRAMRPSLGGTLLHSARRAGKGVRVRLSGGRDPSAGAPASRRVVDEYLSRVEAMAG